jgi:hypothetical protein
MMTEIDRATEYAKSFINYYESLFDKFGWSLPILNGDFINEDEGFQELVIQHIRIKGYKVQRCGDEYELELKLDKEID